jgi:hypothetical protein
VRLYRNLTVIADASVYREALLACAQHGRACMSVRDAVSPTEEALCRPRKNPASG